MLLSRYDAGLLRSPGSAELETRLLSQVISEMAQGVCVSRRRDSTILYVNPRLEEMFGIAADQLVGRLADDAIAFECEDRASFVASCREAVRSSGRWSDELRYRRRDGSQFWGRSTISGCEDPDHGSLSLMVITDVTERHEAEDRLDAQRRLLAESQAAARIGSFERELDSGAVRWSDEQFRLHGRDPALGVPSFDEFLAALHPDDRDQVRAELNRQDATRSAFVHDYRIETPTGGVRWLLVRGDYVPEGSGRRARVSGTSQDVTAERTAQAAQHAAEEQFRRSFDEALVGMVVFGLDGRYMRVNQAFCGIVGHPRDLLLTSSREGITHPEDLVRDDESLGELLAGNRPSYTRELRFIHAAGHAVWVALGVTLIHDAAGAPAHFIAQVQDITERRRYESQLKHMADHDPLTGLLNRRSFERELNSHVARVRRFSERGAVLMIDLDNFKYYNDQHGHSAGDNLIIGIAQGLRDRLRETDVIARLGGDEFAMLLPQEDRDGAETVARALLEHVRQQAPATALGQGKRVTASIGIACFEPQSDLTADEMMVNADLAMYDAKGNGRDGVAHYRTEQHDRSRIESQMKWATEITDALAHDRFELVGQPIQPLHGTGPTQYELLLRMRSKAGDLIPPGTFLYIAERLDLIHEIDRWVVDHAITLLAAQRAAGRDLRFELNLSGQTIGDPELLDLIERRINDTGIAPDRLVFEITETAAIANVARATAFAEHLSVLGCRFALDDFGAGFGSFYYLKHLPFDYLKIDGEFVRHCADSHTDRTLISAVVLIARGLNKATIAECIEDERTVETLKRLGVDYGQGYHLGRPEALHRLFPPTP